VIPCSFVDGFSLFLKNMRPSSYTLKSKAVGTYETSMATYKTARCHNPGGLNLVQLLEALVFI
jgi:hypothetical protein